LMTDPLDAIDQAIESIKRLKSRLAKSSAPQVGSSDEVTLMKATALSWIRSVRPTLGDESGITTLGAVDKGFQSLLEFSARYTTRARCKAHMKALSKSLVSLRTEIVSKAISGRPPTGPVPPPDWSTLVPDQRMRDILTRRWHETVGCMQANAFLAATVMMGAMLEALLLSRVNQVQNKSPLFTANSAPKDKQGQVLRLQQWKFTHYIDVAHEIGWISRPAKRLTDILRDYRNYIHPEKELSEGIVIGEADCHMFWAVFQSLAQQIANSTKLPP
jgi:hypothetical protein